MWKNVKKFENDACHYTKIELQLIWFCRCNAMRQSTTLSTVVPLQMYGINDHGADMTVEGCFRKNFRSERRPLRCDVCEAESATITETLDTHPKWVYVFFWSQIDTHFVFPLVATTIIFPAWVSLSDLLKLQWTLHVS